MVIARLKITKMNCSGIRLLMRGCLVKDKEWSKKLEKFAAFLPELQTQPAVDAKYRKEKPGTDSDLNAYDLLYVSGQSNEGSKTIAINLPNDEKVQ